MSQPQAGIIPEPNQSAWFLVLQVNDPAVNGAAVAGVAAGVPAVVDEIRSHDPDSQLVCTVGFGSEFWDAVSPAKRPAGLRPFKTVDTGVRSAANTPGDVLFHIISKREDLNYELGTRLLDRLGDAVTVVEDVHGFRYLDARDLTGFIDGTENPAGVEERSEVALIGDEDPEFTGGSYVFTQRYVHDLKKWATVAESEQEKIIGRRKTDSEELSDEVKPPTAHISRVVIEEGGEELEIVRHSFPYGTASESGLFFIAYTRNLDITEKMLDRMMGASGDSLYDHLMDFTRAVSGTNFFAPPLEMLTEMGA